MRTLLVLAALAVASSATAQEVGVPSNPVPATITEYRITAFSQQREPDWRFLITWRDNQGGTGFDEHFGLSKIPDPSNPGAFIDNPTGADAFLKQMNTMNFTTTSMVKRLLQHLQQHGKLPPGTVQGTPEAPAAGDPDVFAIIPPKPTPTIDKTGKPVPAKPVKK